MVEEGDGRDRSLDKTPTDSGRSVLALYVLTFLFTGAVIATMMAGYVVFVRALPLYNLLKDGDEHHKRHLGALFQADPELGFSYIPGAQGVDQLPPGHDIPNRIDQHGFRVPASARSDPSAAGDRHPIVLTLGCSFTFGAVTPAEETFAFLVGNALGGTTKNAGVSGAGLSQMLVLARKLIPTTKPDYLIVQYSPWLAERGRSPFAPSIFGLVPQPYFFGEAEPALHAPVFRAIVMDLPWDRYTNTPKSVPDFISFLWNAAAPLAIHDGANLLAFQIKRLFGAVPPPTRDSAKVDRVAYREIAEIGKANGAKLIMVVLGVGADPVKVPLDTGSEYLVVDANATLIGRLPSPDRQNWIKQYAHLRGDPPRAVDFHPNPEAHRIIAEEIVARIKASTFSARNQ